MQDSSPEISESTQSPPERPVIEGQSATGSKLPLKTKVAYGTGGISDFLFMTVPNNMAVPVFSKFFGMDTALLGIATALPRLIGGVADSVVGAVSDNARTRWGRRRPLIVLGASAGALALPFLWLSGAGGVKGFGLFIYVALFLSVYSVFYSLFSVPYQALGYELTQDYNEKTRVQAWKGYLSGVGFILAPWFFWFCTRPVFGDIAHGAVWLSIVCGLLIFLGAVISAGFTRERIESRQQPKIPLIAALRLTFLIGPFCSSKARFIPFTLRFG